MPRIWKKSLLLMALLLIPAGNSFAEEKRELSFEEMMSGQVADKAAAASEKEAPRKARTPAPKRSAQKKAPAPVKAETPPPATPGHNSAEAEKAAPVVDAAFKEGTPAATTEKSPETVMPPASKSEPAQRKEPADAERSAPPAVVALKGEMPRAIAESPVEKAQSPAAAPASPKWFETITVSGLVDVYYSYNGNGYRGMGDNQYLGFAQDSNEFSVALFELNFERKPTIERPTGFYVGLMGGATASIIDQAGDKTAYSGLFRQVYGSFLPIGFREVCHPDGHGGH